LIPFKITSKSKPTKKEFVFNIKRIYSQRVALKVLIIAN